MTDAVTQLNDYIEAATSTAQPAAYDYDYLVPGILGEIGEVYGQLAKSHWHGWSEDKLKEELKAEYGDICWMTAILISKRMVVSELTFRGLDVAPDDFVPFQCLGRISQNFQEFMDKLRVEVGIAMQLEEFPDNEDLANRHEAQEDLVNDKLLELWAALAVLATAATGSSFQDILDYNKAKLASRKARGVLRGSGDHR